MIIPNTTPKKPHILTEDEQVVNAGTEVYTRAIRGIYFENF